jgi:type VI secretion system protein ImpC
MTELPKGGDEQSELPFVIGVLGDFLGHGSAPRLADRRFVAIDSSSFLAVFQATAPGLALTVENALQGDGTMLRVALRFEAFEDFSPDGVARQLQPLATALGLREDPAGAAGLFDQLLRQNAAAPQHNLARQVEAIRHDPDFRRLEASWRGLHLLVSRASGAVYIQSFQVSEDELAKALRTDPDALFDALLADDAPLGLLIGDYAFSHEPHSIETLGLLADVAASAGVPMLAGVSPRLFAVDDMAALAPLGDGDLRRRFDRPDFAKWRSLRDRDEARYLSLVLPRIALGAEGSAWLNGAYLLAARMAESFAATGWCLTLEGPAGRFEPEIEISGERAALLAKQGLVCLTRQYPSDELRFAVLPTLQKPREYDDDAISRNAEAAAQLPCLMAMTQCIRGISTLGREALEAGLSRDQCAVRLNAWIARFVGPAPDLVSTGDPARPLREASIAVAVDRTIYAEARIWPRLPHGGLSAPLKFRVPLS